MEKLVLLKPPKGTNKLFMRGVIVFVFYIAFSFIPW